MPNFGHLGGDPQVTNRYLLEVDSVEIGVFSSVNGLQMSLDTEDIAEGGENGYVHKLPGRMRWQNITFKRGVTDGNALFEWISKTSGEGFASNNNSVDRPSAAVTALGSDGSRLRSWVLDEVLPVRWSGPSFDSTSTSTLEEELEIAHHGIHVR